MTHRLVYRPSSVGMATRLESPARFAWRLEQYGVHCTGSLHHDACSLEQDGIPLVIITPIIMIDSKQ